MNISDDLLTTHKDIFISQFESILNLDWKTTTEIEARFGTIIDHTDGKRLKIPSPHPIILNSNKKYKFISGIEEKDYNTIINELKKNNINLTLKKDIMKIKKNQRERWEDNKCISIITKKRICSYQIYMPHSKYDIRINIAEEIPVENKDKDVIIERHRERNSFVLNEFSIDITKVDSELENSFEVEVEVINEEYDKMIFKNILFNITDKYFKINNNVE
ncbi:mRNA capping enzyme beta chain protein [Spraguea lophii 42_110]|uniref:mRNA-capping enzyme subunit beta n=1 Tax=Spraguea lophii (strain 42_110) TaxID=1358809 RepID=S7XRI2_SPRLO|nr:mRNA capping enzyme beta chain protein [Spraguea lophii 42_110]